jgi:hypothetical protein
LHCFTLLYTVALVFVVHCGCIAVVPIVVHCCTLLYTVNSVAHCCTLLYSTLYTVLRVIVHCCTTVVHRASNCCNTLLYTVVQLVAAIGYQQLKHRCSCVVQCFTNVVRSVAHEKTNKDTDNFLVTVLNTQT